MIGSHGGRAHVPVTGDGQVYVFAQEGARATLLAMPRDGSAVKKLGRVTTAEPPRALVVQGTSAFFTLPKRLMQLPLEGGEVRELASEIGRPLASSQGKLYALRCSAKEDADELVRINAAGGALASVARIPRTNKNAKCEYRALAVTGAAAYVSDWTGRRILKLALNDGAMTVLAEKQPFPGRIMPSATAVVFQAAAGIRRVDENSGEVGTLSREGAMPFESLAWDERHLYVLSTPAYAERDSLFRLPHDGGKREDLGSFPGTDMVTGDKRVDVAVDDQCVYIAHDGPNYTEILARGK